MCSFVTLPRRTRRQGVAATGRHLEDGHQVVVVTGTWDILARRLLDCLDLSDPRVIGSTVRPWAGGLVADEHCYGPRKVRMLTARGLPPPWTCVLTDSASDLPLLEGGGTRLLVNPTVTTRAAVTRRLGDRVRLVHWE